MKFFRYRTAIGVRPGVARFDKHYDLGEFYSDIDREFIEKVDIGRIRFLMDSGKLALIQSPEFDAPIYRPGKIVCIGLNYQKHARESGMEVPEEPVIFFKATSSLCGAFDDVIIPKGSEKTDWEVELAVVVGKKASYVTKDNAMDYVLGYTLHNDVSERAFQLEQGGQWVKGKSCDTFAPLGPYLVHRADIPNPHELNLWLKLNGELLQNGNTSDFIFDIPQVISYVSQFMTLEPGDIISTGTPEGVGLGFDPPRYLKPGDVMDLGIDGLGTSRQTAKAYSNR